MSKRTRAVLDAVCASMPVVAPIPNAPRNPWISARGRIDPANADLAIAWELKRANERRAARKANTRPQTTARKQEIAG